MEATSEYLAPTKDRPLSHGTPSRKLVGLPIARVIPMDVHTMGDYAGALTIAALSSRARSKEARLASVAAPFVLGYRKRDRWVSAIQIASGVAQMLIALFTDYRAYRGRSLGFRR
jgi:hypothetical protein